jgi:hypothetical protein
MRSVNLNHYCLTQAEFDAEDAPHEVKRFRNLLHTSNNSRIIKENINYYILDDTYKLNKDYDGIVRTFWVVKLKNIYTAISNSTLFVPDGSLIPCLRLSAGTNTADAEYAKGYLEGLIDNSHEEYEIVLK